jgi:ethanolamine ammonia-lyase large subunit
MAHYTAQVGVGRTRYPDLRTLLAAAGPQRSRDQLAGLGVQTQLKRVAGQLALVDVSLTDFFACVALKNDDELVPGAMSGKRRKKLDDDS